MDYCEDLDSLALEGPYLIWKSHMITGGWDLSLWLPKSCDKDSLWRSSDLLLLLLCRLLLLLWL